MTRREGGRALKKRVEALLLSEPYEAAQAGLMEIPAKKSINALFSFFCSLNLLLKWRAVSVTGAVVSRLAELRPEEARIIMRRLMWMLNEESGGIGWGVPEAMGEIMAQSPLLSREYNRILLSYIDDTGNLLEHEPIQNGVLWGIHRLASVRPERMASAVSITRPYLYSKDPEKRGLACLIAGYLNDSPAKDRLIELTADGAPMFYYVGGYIRETTVGNLAGQAIDLTETL